jgi:hypothetical protein
MLCPFSICCLLLERKKGRSLNMASWETVHCGKKKKRPSLYSKKNAINRSRVSYLRKAVSISLLVPHRALPCPVAVATRIAKPCLLLLKSPPSIQELGFSEPSLRCSMKSDVELSVTPKLPTVPAAYALLLRTSCFPALSSHICQVCRQC